MHTHIFGIHRTVCLCILPFYSFPGCISFSAPVPNNFFFKGDIDYPFVAEEFLYNPRSVGTHIKQW